MTGFLLVLFYLLAPLLVLYGCKKVKFFNKIGAVVLAYILGLALGNCGILPSPSLAFRSLLHGQTFLPSDEALQLAKTGTITSKDLIVNNISSIQDLVVSLVIPLAISLLLFSLDIKSSFKQMKSGIASFIVAVCSLLIAIVLGHFIFCDSIPESWKISGMMVGLYTGGTPNLAALATALDVQPSLFIMTNTYDLIVSVILLFFFISIGQKVLSPILPRYKTPNGQNSETEVSYEAGNDNILQDFQKKDIAPLLRALGIAILIFGSSYGISLLFPKDILMTVIILSITTFGIIASLIPKIHNIKKTFELGMYLILVFSVTVSSMADLSLIFQIEFLNLFLYVMIAVLGSLLIHVILSAIFRIDTDSTIITITALSMSPPFVPVVAGALKNKNIIVMGITIGVIGYAIGNYLGITMAYFLRGL